MQICQKKPAISAVPTVIRTVGSKLNHAGWAWPVECSPADLPPGERPVARIEPDVKHDRRRPAEEHQRLKHVGPDRPPSSPPKQVYSVAATPSTQNHRIKFQPDISASASEPVYMTSDTQPIRSSRNRPPPSSRAR